MKILREQYLNQLIAGRENGLIKIVSGIRRCGKSFLLFTLFREYLDSQGVPAERIIEVALDDRANIALRNPDALLAHIRSCVSGDGLHYVLLDEVQLVPAFEDVLNSLLHLRNVDVYVTGSNSRFLSSDIVTEFRGRGDEIRLFPLSFSEFCQAYGGDTASAWKDFYTYGGFPHVLSLGTDRKKADYLRNLYRSVHLIDIFERHNVKNRAEFDELVQVVASSVGSPCNPAKLANTFKSVKKIELHHMTIARFLGFLEDAFVVEKALRYSIRGKKYINTPSKYYFSDVGLRNAVLDFRQQEENRIMENIIYNELRVRGFSVDVGAVETRSRDGNGKDVRKQLEVDFVANSGSTRFYIQSAFTIPDDAKLRQETASLLKIPDSFKKIIIVRDDIKTKRDANGILTMGIFDFLLNPDSLNY